MNGSQGAGSWGGGAREGRKAWLLLQVSLWGDRNVLKSDSGDGRTTLTTLKPIDLYT